METNLTKTIKSIIAFTLLLSLTIFVTPNSACGQTMNICPFKIILNAQGNSESVQAVVPMTLESGYLFSGCDATLSVGGVVIAEAYGAKYCYIDDNLLIYFDRMQVYGHATLEELAGTVQTATVEGNLIMVNADGDYLTRAFTRYDDIEIVDPDKKPQ